MTDIFLSDGGSKYPALKFENVNDTHTGTGNDARNNRSNYELDSHDDPNSMCRPRGYSQRLR